MSKQFHIGDILSVYTGCLIGRGGDQNHPLDGVYELLNYLTGESLSTVALPRSASESHLHLKRQFPWLEDLRSEVVLVCKNCPKLPDSLPTERHNAAWREYLAPRLAQWAADHGEWLNVIPLREVDHEVLSAFEDYKRIRPDASLDDVIELDVSEDDPISPIGDIDWKPSGK